MKKESAPLPRMHLRQEETDGLVYLLCMVPRLRDIQTHMEKRLRTIPNGWRNIRMMESVLDNMLTDLLNTVPVDKLVTLQALMPDTRVHVTYTRQIGRGKDDISGILTKDLDMLCTAAHDGVCRLCDKDCDRCQLGKVFDRFLNTTRRKGESYTFMNMDGADAAQEGKTA